MMVLIAQKLIRHKEKANIKSINNGVMLKQARDLRMHVILRSNGKLIFTNCFNRVSIVIKPDYTLYAQKYDLSDV